MAEFQNIKEFLHTGKGTEGTLLLPRKIHDTLIMEVDKRLIPRTLAANYIGPSQIPGSSYDFNLVAPDLMDVRLVGEGAEIPMDVPEYTNTNVKPLKYGVVPKISREMMEDSKFDLLRNSIELAGRRMAENENSLVITALNGGANTVAGGTAITIANITRAGQYLRDSDFTPTHLLIGQEVLTDLQNIDTFVEFQKVGNREMLERGFIGNIYGMDVVLVSTNAGMTTTTSYVIDKTQAYALVEKRPLTVEMFKVPDHDVEAVAITQRVAVGLLRSSAVAIITTS